MEIERFVMNYIRFSRKYFLIFLVVCCALAFLVAQSLYAKNETEQIVITASSVFPQNVQVGQTVDFSADYATTLEDDQFQLIICRSKKIGTQNECMDEAWCISSLSSNNPLGCKYTAQTQDQKNNLYYAFVCNQNNVCSPFHSGSFKVIKEILNLKIPQFISLQPMKFSFEGQNSIGEFDNIEITAEGINRWSLDVSSKDWQNEKGIVISYDGDGQNQGQMSINLDEVNIESENSTAGIILGQTTAFSKKVRNINIATGNKNGAEGTFLLKNAKVKQFIPSNQAEGNYKTELIFTIS